MLPVVFVFLLSSSISSLAIKSRDLALPSNSTSGIHKEVEFGFGYDFSNGFNPSVAILTDQLIVVCYDNNSDIFCQTGYLNGLIAEWNTKKTIGKGTQPRLASNKNETLLLVYSRNESLFIRVASLSNRSISWNSEIAIGFGSSASVSLSSSDDVVLLYRQSLTFVYQFGRINGTAAVFNNVSAPTDINYCVTGISINGFNQIAEVSQLCNSTKIKLKYGFLNGTKIHWSDKNTTTVHQLGKAPAIALNDEGLAVIIQASNTGLISGISADQFNFQQRQFEMGKGSNPQIDCDSRLCVQVHQAADPKILRYSVSYLVDRSRWMHLTPKIFDKALWQICLPGSHDSGAYYSSKSPNVMIPLEICQNSGILSQLRGGVRFLDLRPQEDNDTFYAYHLTPGPEIVEILKEIREFLDSVERELIVLEISHFDFGNSDLTHLSFVNLLVQYLHKYLLTVNYTSAQLITTPLKQLVHDGPKVVIIYQDSFISRNPIVGMWQSLGESGIFNSYANSDNLTIVQTDQLAKLHDNSGSSEQLFLLSYTLTQQIENIFEDFSRGISSLRDLAEPASRSLGNYLISLPKNLTINILLVDFFDDSRVTDLAIWMNRRK